MRGRPSHLDELSQVPPQAFVRARNGLAAELRRRGRRDEAAAVARLRRPAPSVWAVNQLARRDAGAVAAFLEAVERARRAQLGATSDLRPATQAYRAALDRLVERAGAIMASAQVAGSPEVLRRIGSTLAAAAADPAARRALQAGRIETDLDPPGLDVLLDGKAVATPRRAATRRRPAAPAGGPHLTVVRSPSPSAGDGAAARERERREARERDRLASRDRARHRREAQARRRRLRDLEQTSARHRRAAERLEGQARELRGRLEQTERRAAAEREALAEVARRMQAERDAGDAR
jgi:hypothetical protein